MADQRADVAFRRSINTREKSPGTTRVETDSLGSREIPADAYWGINLSRALENFPISGRPISTYSDLVFGYDCVKQAAARANDDRLAKQVGPFVGVITALIPDIGYEAAAKLARETLATNANIADLVVSHGLMTREKVKELLAPERLTSN